MDAQEIATSALNLQIQLDTITAELEEQKEVLRQLADNKKSTKTNSKRFRHYDRP
jgi:hypothetical protein